MKNSNKLLLGGFLLVVGLIATIHISLYAKYKAGNYTAYDPDAYLPAGPLQTFPGVLVVELRDVPSATVQFSDQTQVQKVDGQEVNVVQKGDTLLISSKDSADRSGFDENVNLRLPNNATLLAYGSSVVLTTARNKAPANSSFYLQRSSLRVTGRGAGLERLNVTASDESTVSFPDSTAIGRLDVQLSNSSIRYSEGNIGNLFITTDTLSRISIPSKHLLKATIKNTQ